MEHSIKTTPLGDDDDGWKQALADTLKKSECVSSDMVLNVLVGHSWVTSSMTFAGTPELIKLHKDMCEAMRSVAFIAQLLIDAFTELPTFEFRRMHHASVSIRASNNTMRPRRLARR